LEDLINMGYNNYYMFTSNSLLDPLHNNTTYKRIISIVKEKNDKMRENVLKEGVLVE